MPGGDGDGDRPGEGFRYHHAPLGQRLAGRLHVLIERQFGTIANDGSDDVIAQSVEERREQFARAVQSWQQDEMRCGVQACWCYFFCVPETAAATPRPMNNSPLP